MNNYAALGPYIPGTNSTSPSLCMFHFSAINFLATGTVDDFAINLQLCNEGIDLQKVDIPGVLLQMQRLRSCLGRESELTACLRRLKL